MPRAPCPRDSLASPSIVGWVATPPDVSKKICETLMKEFTEADKGTGAGKTYGVPLSLRPQISFGVNETTKALERGTAKAVVVVVSERSRPLIQHIGQMALRAGVPLAALDDSDKAVVSMLGLVRRYGIRSVVSICVKSDSPLASCVSEAPPPTQTGTDVLAIQRLKPRAPEKK